MPSGVFGAVALGAGVAVTIVGGEGAGEGVGDSVDDGGGAGADPSARVLTYAG